jgi:hypothetical protein
MEQRTYKPEALRALKAFKALKTFKPENADQRRPGLETALNALAAVYDVPVVIHLFNGTENMELPPVTEDGKANIQMFYNKSIITNLYHFAGIRSAHSPFIAGQTHPGRMDLAVGMFAKVYPRQFARLVHDPFTGMYVQPRPEVAPEEAVIEELTQPIPEPVAAVEISEESGAPEEFDEFDEELSAER